MKKSKVLSVVLIAIMLVLTVAGCGKSEQPSATEAESTSKTDPVQKETDTEPVREVVKLKMIGLSEKLDPMTELERERIKEILGYDIEAEIGADAEKISLILSSGQEYDIVKYNDKTVLSQIIANKSVQPLNASIEKYGSNLKEYFSDKVWKMTMDSDGQIYALLNTHYEAVTDLIAVREDWLKALNMKAPENVEEFYNMLKAFKEQNPLNVSNPIPFSVNLENSSNRGLKINGLTQAFGTAASPTSFIEIDGQLMHGFELPGTKDYILFLRKLYKEGLLDADFAVNTNATFEEKIGAGNVGSVATSCWSSNAQKAVKKLGNGAKLTFIEPLADKEGNRKAFTTGGMETFIVVPHASKKVDEVVKFANAFLDPENYQRLVIGDEGVHWEEKDGKKVPIMPAFNDLNMARWFFPVNETSLYTPIFGVRAWKDQDMGAMWEETNALGNKYGYLDPIAYAPALSEVLPIEKKITDYANEQLVYFIIDDTIPESKYDEIVSEYMSMGGDQYIRAYKDWYASTK